LKFRFTHVTLFDFDRLLLNYDGSLTLFITSEIKVVSNIRTLRLIALKV
jgi:hypothetical protein